MAVMIVLLASIAGYLCGLISYTELTKPAIAYYEIPLAEKEAELVKILAVKQKEVQLQKAIENPVATKSTSVTAKGEVVVSKNGSKYHYPWCSGAKRMNESNKVWFKTIAEAKSAGYEPAKNCNGLK